MKRQYPISTKAKCWNKHLKPYGKALANRSTRRLAKVELKNEA